MGCRTHTAPHRALARTPAFCRDLVPVRCALRLHTTRAVWITHRLLPLHTRWILDYTLHLATPATLARLMIVPEPWIPITFSYCYATLPHHPTAFIVI